MAPGSDEVQKAVDIAVLQAEMRHLSEVVGQLAEAQTESAKQITALVHAQVGAKWLGGAIVYLVPVAALVISLLSYLKR